MREESLYIQLVRILQPGDLARTAQQVATQFDRSESQAKAVLGWMANIEKPPTMAEVVDSSPKQWLRI